MDNYYALRDGLLCAQALVPNISHSETSALVLQERQVSLEDPVSAQRGLKKCL